jgi:uncharacterized protein YkwD
MSLAGYLILLTFLLIAAGGYYGATQYLDNQQEEEPINPDGYDEVSVEETPESRFDSRIESLNKSCSFHDKVPDVERGDITIHIEGRPLATHDGHLEGLMHERTNTIRTGAGETDALDCDPQLVKIARDHSEDMAERDFVAHTNPDGQDPFDRLAEADYECPTGGGENLHQGWYGERVETEGPTGYTVPETPEELARQAINRGLYQSPPHRKNMLREEWSVMGIGVYVTENNEVYVTQMFC